MVVHLNLNERFRPTVHTDVAARPAAPAPRDSVTAVPAAGAGDGRTVRATPASAAGARERFLHDPGPMALARAAQRSPDVHPDRTWWAGRPLREGINAHRTNTKEEFAAAVKSDANWFEGDVRKELRSDRLEMRHDRGDEKSGDNLTLKEWLEAGKATGRGLKLDVKEPQYLDRILAETKTSGVPQERLMFNIGANAESIAKIRRQFPKAIIGINAPGDDGALKGGEVDRMIALANQAGGPVTFISRYDRLTDEAIKRLSAKAPVSVWNSVGDGGLSASEVPRVRKELRARGVDGIIDLRAS